MGYFTNSMFCYALFCVFYSFAIILVWKRVLVALLCLSSLCIVIVSVLQLILVVPWVGLQCVIVVFPDYTYLLFIKTKYELRRLYMRIFIDDEMLMRSIKPQFLHKISVFTYNCKLSWLNGVLLLYWAFIVGEPELQKMEKSGRKVAEF